MHHDQLSVAGHVDVTLDHFDSQLNGFAIGFQRVFRVSHRLTAMHHRKGTILTKPGIS